MPEVTEQDLASFRTTAAKLAEVEKSNQQLAQQVQARDQVYQRDIQQLAQMVNQPAPATADPNDDEPISLTNRQLREITGKASEAAVNRIAGPVVENQFRSARDTNRKLARMQYGEEFTRWGQEIDRMLDQQGLQIAATPGAYDAAVQAVRALHLDEIIEERVSKRAKPPVQAEDDDEQTDQDDEPEHAASSESAAAVPRRNAEAPVPSGGGTGVPHRQAKAKRVELDQDETKWAKRAGMSGEEYSRMSNPKYSEDVFGFKGRERI